MAPSIHLTPQVAFLLMHTNHLNDSSMANIVSAAWTEKQRLRSESNWDTWCKELHNAEYALKCILEEDMETMQYLPYHSNSKLQPYSQFYVENIIFSFKALQMLYSVDILLLKQMWSKYSHVSTLKKWHGFWICQAIKKWLVLRKIWLL